MQEQLSVVKLLLAWGADRAITMADEDDGPQTALDLAREAERADLVAALEAAETPDGLAKLKAEMLPATDAPAAGGGAAAGGGGGATAAAAAGAASAAGTATPAPAPAK